VIRRLQTIDECGGGGANGIVNTKQCVGFVLAGAGHDEKDSDSETEVEHESQGSRPEHGQSSLFYSMKSDHV
jgi:hypothetical protein